MSDPKNQIPREFESDPALWELLGQSRAAEPGPFFVQKTLRLARNSGGARRNTSLVHQGIHLGPGRFGWGRVALAGGLCTLLAAMLGILIPRIPLLNRSGDSSPQVAVVNMPTADFSDTPAHQPNAVIPETASATPTAEDAEIIAQLGALLALEENRLWTESGELF